MAVPKRRTGKTKRNMRRSHHAITAPQVIEHADSGEPSMPHRVCSRTGMYKGRQVHKIKD